MITRFGEPGAVLLIRGEPGIGKSRLLARIIEEAVRLGFRTSCGSAAELGRPVPFGALAAVPADAVVPVPRHPVGGEGAYRVVESLVAAVSARAAAGPVLIAVDDLHRADPATLLALRGFCRRLAGLPVVVVATLRPAERDADRPRAAAGPVRAAGRGGGAVETHLKHVFTKLGVSGRAELAAVGARRELRGADPGERVPADTSP